jgi:pyruvate formate lyase activating enzyme
VGIRGRAAAYGTAVGRGAVRCGLCPNDCVIPDGGRGSCQVRANRGGVLVAENYGRVAAASLDPIEKKPLYHFHPGSLVYSLGSPGCNLHCRYCQNWRYSQAQEPADPLSPSEAVERALAARRRDPGVVGLCYTYTDPIIWFEYVLDTARLARQVGLVNVLKTNGYVNPEPLAELLEVADALNVDVKAFSEPFYRQVCGAGLAPVLRTVEAAVRAGRHVEVTALLVPGRNDSPAEVDALAGWLAALGESIPLHLARFFPNYRMEGAPTSVASLESARDTARRHLRHVYITGAWGADHGATRCPGCGETVIRRDGFRVRLDRVEGGRCACCGADLGLVGAVRRRG